LKFADDQEIVANSKQGLQQLIDSWITRFTTVSMYRIVYHECECKENKTMIVSKFTSEILNITVDGRVVKQVNNRYLGFGLPRMRDAR